MKNYDGINTYSSFGSIRDSVTVMQKAHLDAEKDLKLFHDITDNYSLPYDTCNAYKYLFKKMREFESDLVWHTHLENDILFPKAVALEEELKHINKS